LSKSFVMVNLLFTLTPSDNCVAWPLHISELLHVQYSSFMGN
jgi:hypothetical protein